MTVVLECISRLRSYHHQTEYYKMAFILDVLNSRPVCLKMYYKQPKSDDKMTIFNVQRFRTVFRLLNFPVHNGRTILVYKYQIGEL